jgi:hypothetical protein
MRRMQIYLTDDQRREIARRAADEGVAQADVIRRILDVGLGIEAPQDEKIAALRATAGVLRDYPDWPEWLADVRGRGADERLKRLGL